MSGGLVAGLFVCLMVGVVVWVMGAKPSLVPIPLLLPLPPTLVPIPFPAAYEHEHAPWNRVFVSAQLPSIMR